MISENKPQPKVAAKLKELIGQLDATSGRFTPPEGGVEQNLAEQAMQAAEGVETVADDAPMPPAVVEAVTRYEAVVREVLALLGESYDDLIRMDEKSPYAAAVAANPSLLQQVAAAPNPVLAALQVALSFRPIMAFTQKYGSTPDAIKDAMRQEILAEMQGAGKAAQGAEPAVAVSAPAFSSRADAAPKPKKKAQNADSLADIFKR